jgi:L-threonylcarbamoyladenylate synthase
VKAVVEKSSGPARILRPTPRNLARLAAVLARGGLVAVPTETVYGLAADALNPAACRAIFRAKGRPSADPLIVHVRTLAQADAVAVLNLAARRLAAAFWPGPLTLVLPRRACVPAVVTAGLDSVAVRLPRHRLFRTLLRLCGRPLAAPSANPFGYISPTTAAHVRAGLGARIAHILDGGACAIGVESTILDLRDPARPVLLRPGAISRAALEKVLGRRVRVSPRARAARPLSAGAGGPPALPGEKARAGMLAPGMLARHYSPRTPLTLEKKLPPPDRVARTPHTAFLYFRRPAAGPAGAKNIFWLTPDGRPAAAARSLYTRLRALDRGGWQAIRAERVPGAAGLAAALNDRLARAAAR